MKTGTKHQNKNNRGKEGGKQKKKRKAVNTKRTEEENTCWKEGKGLYIHATTNRTVQIKTHLNQGCLRSIKV